LVAFVYVALAITFAIGAFAAARRGRRGVAIALGLLAAWALLGWVGFLVVPDRYD
jgi:hypothetical protein